MSPSSISTLTTCSEQYRLERVEDAPRRPGWGGIGGSAVHSHTEWLDELQHGTDQDVLAYDTIDDDFEYFMAYSMNRELRWTTYPMDQWRAGGRSSKDWPNRENLDWWLTKGSGFVKTYASWRRETGWPMWEDPAGNPMIELDLRVQCPQNPHLEVRCITDRIMVYPSGEPIIVDIKSGSFKQNNPIQLAYGALTCELTFGFRPALGMFADLRQGVTSDVWHLDNYSDAMLWDRAAKARLIRDNELFVASPSNLCSSCGVKDFCRTMRGSRAEEYPVHFIPLERINTSVR